MALRGHGSDICVSLENVTDEKLVTRISHNASPGHAKPMTPGAAKGREALCCTPFGVPQGVPPYAVHN